MKQRIIFIALMLAFLCSMLPQSVSAANNEAEIYTEYLVSTGYKGIEFDDMDPEWVSDVCSYMIDLNGDGIKELLLHVYTGSYGVTGTERYSFLFSIKNGKVNPVLESYYGGGSMGGDDLVLKYDSAAQKTVVAISGFERDGVYRTTSHLSIHSGNDFSCMDELSGARYAKEFYEKKVAEIRKETSLYEEDEYDFYCYSRNGEYISKSDYETATARYVDLEYEMYTGTYYEPIGNADDPPATTEPAETEASVALDWDAAQWKMSAEQAQAYAELIETAMDRFEMPYQYEDDKAIYARLFDVQGMVYLWIAGARVMDGEPFWHCAFEYRGKWLDFEYEELWYWNGFYAMEFEFVSDYGASMNLWPDGIEAYTFYRGTDYDGEAWGAFFPFEDGRLNLSPQWSYAWAVMYDYKFEDLDVNGKSDKEKAELFFKNQISSGAWPELNYDWSSLTINAHDKAEIIGGEGYDEFRNKYGYDTGHYHNGGTNSSQKSFDLENDDGTWKTADSAAAWLRGYAETAQKIVELHVSADYTDVFVGETFTVCASMTENVEICEGEFSFDTDDSLQLVDVWTEGGETFAKFRTLAEGTCEVTVTETQTEKTASIPITIYPAQKNSDDSHRQILLIAIIAFAVLGIASAVGIVFLLRKKRDIYR